MNIFYLKIGITTLNKIIYSTYSNFWQSEMRLQMICTVKTYLFISKLFTILKDFLWFTDIVAIIDKFTNLLRSETNSELWCLPYLYRVATRISYRIKELQNIPAALSDDMKTKANIELRALRLLNFQRQVRRNLFI